MVTKLLLSHGRLASELLAAARRIVAVDDRDAASVTALSLAWDEDCESIERRLRARLAELDEGDGVLLLTDLLGATPTRAARRVLEPGRYELVTGMNLAMIVRLACHPPAVDVSELALWIVGKGRKGIQSLSEPSEAPTPSGEEGDCGDGA